MKRYIYILVVVVLFFVSCKPEEPQYSPQMYFSSFVAYHADSLHTSDTLRLRMIDDKYVFDTISVGDTVRFSMICDAVVNQLTSFEIKSESNIVTLSLTISSEQQEVLEATSDIENCLLNFKAGYSGFGFPVQYIADKSGSEVVNLTLSSTSSFSPTKISFRQPIR
ncbi:MAG: hypothetical protein J5612_01530 [Paludibacteraceae bacterium]|nr:hypothetical protein [Paludibacteraceae bacterium]